MLVVRAGTARVGLPLASALETLRPLPCAPLPHSPPWVTGASVIRGAPTPVVDLGQLLGGAPAPPTRLVTVRAGARVVALAVQEVLGIRTVARAAGLPPVLAGSDERVAALSALDAQLLLVLREGCLLEACATEAPAG